MYKSDNKANPLLNEMRILKYQKKNEPIFMLDSDSLTMIWRLRFQMFLCSTYLVNFGLLRYFLSEPFSWMESSSSSLYGKWGVSSPSRTLLARALKSKLLNCIRRKNLHFIQIKSFLNFKKAFTLTSVKNWRHTKILQNQHLYLNSVMIWCILSTQTLSLSILGGVDISLRKDFSSEENTLETEVGLRDLKKWRVRMSKNGNLSLRNNKFQEKY